MQRASTHFPAHQSLRTCALTPDTRVLRLQNKDGLVDIVAVSSVSNNITWYANRGGSMPSWTSNTLGGASPLTAPMGVTVADSTCCVDSVQVQVQGCAPSDTVVCVHARVCMFEWACRCVHCRTAHSCISANRGGEGVGGSMFCKLQWGMGRGVNDI